MRRQTRPACRARVMLEPLPPPPPRRRCLLTMIARCSRLRTGRSQQTDGASLFAGAAGTRQEGGYSPGAVLSRPDAHSRTWLLCVHLAWLTRLIQSSGQGLAVTSGPLFSEVSQYLGPSKRRGAPNGQQVRVLPARVCVRGRQERRRRSPRASDSEPGSLLSVVPCLRPVADPLART